MPLGEFELRHYPSPGQVKRGEMDRDVQIPIDGPTGHRVSSLNVQKIRNATPHDAAFLAWLILTSGRAHVKRGIWEVILHEPEAECRMDERIRI